MMIIRDELPSSIGEYIAKLSTDYSCETDYAGFEIAVRLSQCVQKWADLLGMHYRAISDLQLIKDNTLTLEELINATVKSRCASLLKSTDVMATVLGSKNE